MAERQSRRIPTLQHSLEKENQALREENHRLLSAIAKLKSEDKSSDRFSRGSSEPWELGSARSASRSKGVQRASSAP